jgi:hypothetical protein
MSDERAERCDRCRFWEDADDAPFTEGTVGFCCRHAPTPIAPLDTDRPGYYPLWPLVLANHWCGEFQPLKQT